MKLDAGTPEVLERINRPAAGLALDEIVEGLSRLGNITLQSAFVDGEVANCSDRDVESWLARVERIKPVFVQVYSLEDAPAMETLRGVPLSRLEEIVAKLQRMGIKAGAY